MVFMKFMTGNGQTYPNKQLRHIKITLLFYAQVYMVFWFRLNVKPGAHIKTFKKKNSVQ